MHVGVSGHQHRPGIDWSWVNRAVRSQLSNFMGATKAYSSLATGSDQVFAEAAIHLKIPVVAVLPLEGYERYFEGSDLADYRRLLAQSEVVQLGWNGDPERAFLEAGKFVVENCEVLFAIWDGEGAEGLGGTADIVAYASRLSRTIIHINPIAQRIGRK
jgi:hypothetical protein